METEFSERKQPQLPLEELELELEQAQLVFGIHLVGMDVVHSEFWIILK